MATTTLIKIFSFLLGFLYVTFIGFFSFPIHLQASLFYLIFLFGLYVLNKKLHRKATRFSQLLFVSGILLAGCFTFTSNNLVLIITHLTENVILSLLLVTLFIGKLPDTPITYIRQLLQFCLYFVTQFFSPYHLFSLVDITLPTIPWKKYVNILLGVLISIPILFIFHFLFASANTSYLDFISNLFSVLWEIMKYIFNIEFIWDALKIFLQGYLFYTLLSLRQSSDEDQKLVKHLPEASLKVLLGMVIGLFLIFSSFQSQVFVMDIFHLPFKEISQYVQQGFAELLLVTLIGYILIQFVFSQLKVIKPKKPDTRILLSIFELELLAIVVFIAHKLFVLESVFGFKDQRIVASIGVLLIGITFIILLFQTWRKIAPQKVFQSQLIMLSFSVLCLNLLNVDHFVSQFNTIRFYKNEVAYKDYSYLLGNSYDNVSEWEAISNELLKIDLPVPDRKYYWGRYSSRQTDYFGGTYPPICETNGADSHLREHYESMLRKYSDFNLENKPLTLLTQFNFREYQAYLFIKNNKELVTDVVVYANSRCRE